MARVIGGVIRTSNYELNQRKPLDARSLVPTYEDLLVKTNWFDGVKVTAYNGMLVSVANTSDTSRNGLYMLFDINCTTALKSPDVTIETNWIKIGENSDISSFIKRIESIENDLTEISQDISSLDSRIATLESEDKLHTYAYRNGFPGQGQDGHMYIAIDEGKNYVWANNEYISIGGSSYEEPAVIYGGSAD